MTARTASQIFTTSRLDELVTERDFQAAVVEIAHWNRWDIHHQFDSRHSAPGWPDLTLIRPPEIIFVELKTETGKVSPAQARVLEQLVDCGLEAVIWRPSMLATIAIRLQGHR